MTSSPSTHLPAAWFQHGNQVIVLEAPPGRPRRELIESWLGDAAVGGARTWLLPCGFAAGGPWAGVRELVASCVDGLSGDRPELLRRHAYELVRVLPELRGSLGISRESLTELAPPKERVRNYPADRAFRLVHGLIDLLAELESSMGEESWVVACDDFDSPGAISRRFFAELIRRRGRALRLTLVVAIGPAAGAASLAELPRDVPRLHVSPAGLAGDQGSADVEPADPEAMAEAAAELEERVGDDPIAGQIHLPELIRLWTAAGRPRRALRWLELGLEIYNVMGIYEDSVVYGERALAVFKAEGVDDPRLRWQIVGKLFMSYLALGRSEDALRFLQAEAPLERHEPFQRAQICYSVAMLYARHLPQRDLARGEEYLAEGLRHLKEAKVAPEDSYFTYVFNRNGLALIRHFQGRPQEAIALCREGYALLEEHMRPEAHRLHRSVLVYNMAQVYTAIGATEEAIEHYRAVIEMDPNYSEYHNDRGNIYLRLGRFAEALADYRRASALSPPYPEVYTNLGQCYRKLGRMDEAVESYSRAIDLQPDVVLALVGRAQAFDALERAGEAIADYTAALDIDPGLWEARLNRAICHYGLGRLEACLGDLDEAVRLAPGMAQLYANRAIALADLGRREEAAADLQEYLRREPLAEDRAEVLERIAVLGSPALGSPAIGSTIEAA
jgi:tetratricopeptide (TPR) repeat protein